MTKVCIPCNAVMDAEICSRCLNANAEWRMTVEIYKEYPLMRYSYETGYRVDMGTIRSKEVQTTEEARALIDSILKR
jgi:hypothetical protein